MEFLCILLIVYLFKVGSLKTFNELSLIRILISTSKGVKEGKSLANEAKVQKREEEGVGLGGR
jgi:hypothetical protein